MIWWWSLYVHRHLKYSILSPGPVLKGFLSHCYLTPEIKVLHNHLHEVRTVSTSVHQIIKYLTVQGETNGCGRHVTSTFSFIYYLYHYVIFIIISTIKRIIYIIFYNNLCRIDINIYTFFIPNLLSPMSGGRKER